MTNKPDSMVEAALSAAIIGFDTGDGDVSAYSIISYDEKTQRMVTTPVSEEEFYDLGKSA